MIKTLRAAMAFTAAAKRTVNANNATLGVTWEKSYVNGDKTKTCCVHDAPSEVAVRERREGRRFPVRVDRRNPRDSLSGLRCLTR